MRNIVRVVLVEPEGEDNIGLVARAMSNFCFDELVLVNPKTKITKNSYRRAMHGSYVLKKAKAVKTLNQALKSCKLVVGTTGKPGGGYNVYRTPVTPKQFSEKIKKIKSRVALVFGRESIGLKNSELEKCDVVITIPTHSKNRILNISHAASIIFYEIFSSGAKAVVVPANPKEKQALLKIVKKQLDAYNCAEEKKKIMLKTLRNLLGRSVISEREFYTLAGIFRAKIKGHGRRNKV